MFRGAPVRPSRLVACASVLLLLPFRSNRAAATLHAARPFSRVSHALACARFRAGAVRAPDCARERAQGALLLSVPLGIFRAGGRRSGLRMPLPSVSSYHGFRRIKSPFRIYFSIAQTYRAASRRRRLRSDAHRRGGDGLGRQRSELKLGYGFAAFGDRCTSTPEIGIGLSDTGRDYSLGWWLVRGGFGAPDGGSFELSVEATRRESANDNARPEHEVGFRQPTSGYDGQAAPRLAANASVLPAQAQQQQQENRMKGIPAA